MNDSKNEDNKSKLNCELDKILDRLFLSGDGEATNLKLLKENNITHIVNVATNVDNKFESEIIYKKISVKDNPTEDIRSDFKETYNFIEQALQNENNSVLVHCNKGISRSPSIVIAYLLQKRIFDTYEEAYEYVKSKRPKSCPNEGFIQQLKQVEKELNN